MEYKMLKVLKIALLRDMILKNINSLSFLNDFNIFFQNLHSYYSVTSSLSLKI